MMSEPIHLVMPMSGQGKRFRDAGYPMIKPLIPVNGVPMVQRLLTCFPSSWPTHFVLSEAERDSSLPELLKKLRPDATLSYVQPHKEGPGHAVEAALPHLPEGAAVLVSYCDYGMQWDAAAFERYVRATRCDACVVSYRGFHAHYLSPVTYAYSRTKGQQVLEVREKASFTDDRESEFASCGAYYFRTPELLARATAAQRRFDLRLNGELYTSLTVEALLRDAPKSDVRVFEIPGFFQWGTPADLRSFIFCERSFHALLRNTGQRGHVAQVLMPMAGLGSRFAACTPLPKPLIPVDERPMFAAALDSLPEATNTVIVALESMKETLRKNLSGREVNIVALERTPEGQALSCEAGASALHLDQEVMVSACDHAVALDPSRWKAFRALDDCDVAVFTMRGVPAAARTPRAFAYVVPEQPNEAFPEVRDVSVKQPVSETPLDDQVLVGTFWFKQAAFMLRGIDIIKRENIRVRGELYLDSILMPLKRAGLRVRMVELDGYICWGDPDALSEALYYTDMFSGRSIEQRNRYPGVARAPI